MNVNPLDLLKYMLVDKVLNTAETLDGVIHEFGHLITDLELDVQVQSPLGDFIPYLELVLESGEKVQVKLDQEFDISVPVLPVDDIDPSESELDQEEVIAIANRLEQVHGKAAQEAHTIALDMLSRGSTLQDLIRMEQEAGISPPPADLKLVTPN